MSSSSTSSGEKYKVTRPKKNPTDVQDMMLSFRASAGMKMAIDVAANYENMSRTDWIRQAVATQLALHNAKQQAPRAKNV